MFNLTFFSVLGAFLLTNGALFALAVYYKRKANRWANAYNNLHLIASRAKRALSRLRQDDKTRVAPEFHSPNATTSFEAFPWGAK